MPLVWSWLTLHWLPVCLHGGSLWALWYVYSRRKKLFVIVEPASTLKLK